MQVNDISTTAESLSSATDSGCSEGTKKAKRHRRTPVWHRLIATIALALLATTSCDDADYEYSSNTCYVLIEVLNHLETALTSALVQDSPGVFCHIYTPGDSYFYFENNQGLSAKSAMNATDLQRTLVLGVYNGSGIIVGYGTLESPAILYCYDYQCPNCYDDTGLPRYGLSMNDAGIATCSNCQRKYDMNNGGYVSDGGSEGDHKLMRYRVSYSSGSMILYVNN